MSKQQQLTITLDLVKGSDPFAIIDQLKALPSVSGVRYGVDLDTATPGQIIDKINGSTKQDREQIIAAVSVNALRAERIATFARAKVQSGSIAAPSGPPRQKSFVNTGKGPKPGESRQPAKTGLRATPLTFAAVESQGSRSPKEYLKDINAVLKFYRGNLNHETLRKQQYVNPADPNLSQREAADLRWLVERQTEAKALLHAETEAKAQGKGAWANPLGVPEQSSTTASGNQAGGAGRGRNKGAIPKNSKPFRPGGPMRPPSPVGKRDGLDHGTVPTDPLTRVVQWATGTAPVPNPAVQPKPGPLI